MLGTMSIPDPLDTAAARESLDYFAAAGFDEIDTAPLYQAGLTERTLGENNPLALDGLVKSIGVGLGRGMVLIVYIALCPRAVGPVMFDPVMISKEETSTWLLPSLDVTQKTAVTPPVSLRIRININITGILLLALLL